MTKEEELAKEKKEQEALIKEAETKVPDKVAEAKEIVERQEAANKETARLQEVTIQLQANAALGGGSPAGQAPVEKKELTDVEYKDKVMAGEIDDK